MALLVGYPGGYASGNTATVDATYQQPLGTRGFDVNGKEYIYLLGATTIITSAGWVVTYATTFVPTLIAGNAIAPVAVSMAVVDTAAKAGWYQIWGHGSAKSDTVAGAAQLYIDGTAGRIDDAVVAGDLVIGMISTGADATNVCPVWLNYPYVSDVLG